MAVKDGKLRTDGRVSFQAAVAVKGGRSEKFAAQTKVQSDGIDKQSAGSSINTAAGLKGGKSGIAARALKRNGNGGGKLQINRIAFIGGRLSKGGAREKERQEKGNRFELHSQSSKMGPKRVRTFSAALFCISGRGIPLNSEKKR